MDPGVTDAQKKVDIPIMQDTKKLLGQSKPEQAGDVPVVV